MTTLEGHSKWVSCAAFSPDCTRVVTGSTDETLRVYSVKSGTCERTLRGHADYVMSTAFSFDGSLIASGSNDKTVRVWRVDTGECWQTLRDHMDGVWCVAFAPTRRPTRVASGSCDGVKVWNVEACKCERTLQIHSDSVTCVAFSPDGKRIVSGSRDKTVRIYDMNIGECVRTLNGHSGWINGVAFSPDGTRIASVSDDKSLLVWNAESGECQREHLLQGLKCVAFLSDLRVAVGSYDGSVTTCGVTDKECVQTLMSDCPVISIAVSSARVWVASVYEKGVRVQSEDVTRDANTNECVMTLDHSHWVNCVACSADYVISGGLRTIRAWNAKTGECERTFETGAVTSVAISSNSQWIVSGEIDKMARVWNAETGECIRTLRGHEGTVMSVAFAGTRVVSGSADATLKVWNVDTGECIRTLQGHSQAVTSVACSPDALVVSGSYDASVKMWNLQTNACEWTRRHRDIVLSVAFSPDGTRVVSCSADLTVKTWSVKCGSLERTFEGHDDMIKSVAFSPDGMRIVGGSLDKTLRVWNVGTGVCERTLRGHSDWVDGVAFSPDGKWIASGSRDKTVRVWWQNLITKHSFALAPEETAPTAPSAPQQGCDVGKCERTFQGHQDWVKSVAFSPDGTRVASASIDESVKVWRTDSGECALTLQGHICSVRSVAFSPDGTRIASGSYDCSLKVWNVESNIGTCEYTLHHLGPVLSVTFSPDGTHVASGSHDRTLRVWNVVGNATNIGTSERMFLGHSDWVTSVAYSPDGTLIVSGSEDKTLRLWNAHTGAHVRTLEGHANAVMCVAFSPDGTRIVSGSIDNSVRVWCVSGECIRTLQDHPDGILSVAFLPDGTHIVSGSIDHKVRVYDSVGSTRTLTFEGHSGGVTSVACSPDGTRIASGSYDKSVKVWSVYAGACGRNRVATSPPKSLAAAEHSLAAEQRYKSFYKNNCRSLDARTFSGIKDRVLEFVCKDDCPPHVRIMFGDWLFNKIWMYYKVADDKKAGLCEHLESSIDECPDTVIKGEYLHWRDVDAINLIALYFYLNPFSDKDKYFVLQLQNDVQLVKNYVQDARITDAELRRHFIAWLKASSVLEQQSNILDVLLRYYSKDADVVQIYEKMRWGGGGKGCLYQDEQNVHDKDIQRSTIDAAEKLLKWDAEDPLAIPPETTFRNFVSGVLYRCYPNGKRNTVDCVVERMCIDTTTFGESSFTISELFLALLNYIGRAKDSKALFEVLMEEFEGMKALCSSGYVARLINVLQGFDEEYRVTISFEKQLYAVLSKKLAEALNKASENVVLGTMEEEHKEEYLRFVQDVVNKEIPRLCADYGADDVKVTIIGVLVSISGHSRWDYKNDKVWYDFYDGVSAGSRGSRS